MRSIPTRSRAPRIASGGRRSLPIHTGRCSSAWRVRCSRRLAAADSGPGHHHANGTGSLHRHDRRKRAQDFCAPGASRRGRGGPVRAQTPPLEVLARMAPRYAGAGRALTWKVRWRRSSDEHSGLSYCDWPAWLASWRGRPSTDDLLRLSPTNAREHQETDMHRLTAVLWQQSHWPDAGSPKRRETLRTMQRRLPQRGRR